MCLYIQLGVAMRDLKKQFPGLMAAQWPARRREEIQAGDLVQVIRPDLPGSDSSAARPELARWGLVGAFLDAPPSRPLQMLPLAGLDKRPFYNRLLAGQRCAVAVRSFVLPGLRGQLDRRVARADGRGMLLAAVYDHHPQVGWSFALIEAGAPGQLGPTSGWPLMLHEEDAAVWFGDWQAHVAEFGLQLPGAERGLTWQVEALPRPEPSPQLALNFAWA